MCCRRVDLVFGAGSGRNVSSSSDSEISPAGDGAKQQQQSTQSVWEKDAEMYGGWIDQKKRVARIQ